MSTLMRAPEPCGSWFWDLEDVAEPGLSSALSVADRMCQVLTRQDLLIPLKLEYLWYVLDSGGLNITSTMSLSGSLNDQSLPDRILGSRPVAFPDAQPDDVHIVGPGYWIDDSGSRRKEPLLINLSVSPAPVGLSAELAVHHDIWGFFDFSGQPHPKIFERNSVRLEAALREISEIFQVTPEVGDPTFFGCASEFGIGMPDVTPDGLGPDVTHRL
ncbi:hypothetical protein ABZ929_04200 [Streptomyces physcomitrii]|uniref:hypothetical protein n=1 Tax=Streptomyces physcomitrii TaxID=2724184 RepID=UPI0033E193A1